MSLNASTKKTFEITHADHPTTPFQVTVGYSDDGSPREIFINGAIAGSQFEAVVHDGAVMVSQLLRHGVPIETIHHALTRNEDGSPSTVICAVVDRLCAPAPTL
jgi:hypothetical protein